MGHRVKLAIGDMARPNRKNLAYTDSDHNEFRLILRNDMRKWLNNQGFPYKLEINRFEYYLGDEFQQMNLKLQNWEIFFEGWIIFDDPAHAVIFKLTFGV